MRKNNLTLIRRQIDKTLINATAISGSLKAPKSGWLCVIREALGMTTSQLAKRLGVTPTSVAKAETNKTSKKISIETLKKIADQLDCELIYLRASEVIGTCELDCSNFVLLILHPKENIHPTILVLIFHYLLLHSKMKQTTYYSFFQ